VSPEPAIHCSRPGTFISSRKPWLSVDWIFSARSFSRGTALIRSSTENLPEV